MVSAVFDTSLQEQKMSFLNLFSVLAIFIFQVALVPFASAEEELRPKPFEKCIDEKQFPDTATIRAFFEDRFKNKECREKLNALELRTSTLSQDLARQVKVIDALKAKMNTVAPNTPEAVKLNDNYVDADTTGKAIESKLVTANSDLYLSPLIDQCGAVWTKPIKDPVKLKNSKGVKEVWYEADGVYALFDQNPEVVKAAYDSSTATLSDLRNYTRQGSTQKGFEHVWAFDRVDKDGNVIVGKDDVSHEEKFFAFIAAGNMMGTPLSYWYYVDNNLTWSKPDADRREFRLTFESSKEPALAAISALKKPLEYISAVGTSESPFTARLPHAFGGWCIEEHLETNPPFLWVRYQTAGNFRISLPFGIAAAKSALYQTLAELRSGKVTKGVAAAPVLAPGNGAPVGAE
jgi:hypothetical protein